MSEEMQISLMSTDETLAEDGRRMTVENVTLWQTPLPLAASTVARTKKDSIGDDGGGSFLDGRDITDGQRFSFPQTEKLELGKGRAGDLQSNAAAWRRWVNCPPSPDESVSIVVPMGPRDMNQQRPEATDTFDVSQSIPDEDMITQKLFLTNKENVIDSISPPSRLRPDSRVSITRSSLESRASDMSSLGIFDINDVSDFAISLSPQKPVSSRSWEHLKKSNPRQSDFGLEDMEDDDDDDSLTTGLAFATNSGGLETVKRLSSQMSMMSAEVVEMPRYSNDSHASAAIGDSMVSMEGASQTDSSGRTLLQTFIQASTTQDSFSNNLQTNPPRLKSCLKRPSLPRVEASPDGRDTSRQEETYRDSSYSNKDRSYSKRTSIQNTPNPQVDGQYKENHSLNQMSFQNSSKRWEDLLNSSSSKQPSSENTQHENYHYQETTSSQHTTNSDDVPEKLQHVESNKDDTAPLRHHTESYTDTPYLPSRNKPLSSTNNPRPPLNFGEMVFEGCDSEDLDASVADVQFGEDELEQFDEEFSDLEIDNTLTDDAASDPNSARDAAQNAEIERAREILEGGGESSLSLDGDAELEDVNPANDSSDSGNEGSLAASAHSSQTAMDVLRGLGLMQNQLEHVPLQEEKTESHSETQSEEFQESRHVRFASPMELRERDRHYSTESLPKRVYNMSEKVNMLQDQMFDVSDKSHDPLFDPSLTRMSGELEDVTHQGQQLPWQQIEGHQESSGPSDMSFNGAASLPFLSDSQSQTSSGSRSQSRFYTSSVNQSVTPKEDGNRNTNNAELDNTPVFGPKVVRSSPHEPATSPGFDRLSNGRVSLSEFMKPTVPDDESKVDSHGSAVYMNEEGEYVTDLAYRNSFEEAVQHQKNPFDVSVSISGANNCSFAAGPSEFGETWGNPGELPEVSFDFNEDFQPAGNKLDQFDADEQEFEAENQFRPDEQISQVSFGLPDNWSLHSAMYSPVDAAADYMRISIGAFMFKRTEALGSLGDYADLSDERPNFGLKVTTPPSERPPIVLHQPSSPEEEESPVARKSGSVSLDLDDLDDTIQAAKSKSNSTWSKDLETSTNKQQDELQADESPNQSPLKSSHLSTNELEASPLSTSQQQYANLSLEVTNHQHYAKQSSEGTNRQQYANQSLELTNQRLSPYFGEKDVSSSEDNSGLNLSSISRLIATAPAEMKSKDLANIIMRASQTKHRKSSTRSSGRPEAEETSKLAYNADVSSVSVTSETSTIMSDSHSKVVEGRKSRSRSQELRENVTKSKRESGRSSLPTKTSISRKSDEPSKKASSAKEKRTNNSKRSSYSVEDKINTSRRSSTTSVGRSSSTSRSSLDRTSTSMTSRSSTGTKILKDSSRSSIEKSSCSENALSKIPVPRSRSSEGRSLERKSLSRDRSLEREDMGREKGPIGSASLLNTPPTKLGGDSWSSPPPTSHLSQSQRMASRVKMRRLERGEYNSSLYEVGSDTFQEDGMNTKGALSLSEDSSMATLSNSVQSKSTAEQVQLQIREVAAKNLGLDNNVLRDITPTNMSSEFARKARHSSTPMLPGQQAHISIDTTTGSLSRISPESPHNQGTVNSGEKSTDQINASQMRPEKALKQNYMGHDHQSTPKKSNRRDTEPIQPRRLSPEDPEVPVVQPSSPPTKGHAGLAEDHLSDPYQPITSWKHGLLPENFDQQQHTVPTLLTNASLSKTPFAQQFLPMSQNDTMTSNISGRSAMLTMDSTVSTRYNSLPEPLYKVQHPNSEQLTSLDALQNNKYKRQSAEPVAHPYSDVRTNRPTPRSFEGVTDDFRTVPGSILSVKVPGELEISEVCCVGLSCWVMLPIHNPTGRWLQASLELTTLTVDGQAHNPAMVNPFHHRVKVIVEPQMTSEVKIIFTPRQPGAYIGELSVNVDVVSDQPYRGHCIPSIVTIQAVAEKPKIQVLADDGPILDFGAVAWGGTRSLPLTLINNGQAGIPLRLSVSSSRSAWQCFTFDRRTSGNSSVISRSSRSLSTVAPSIANYYLPPSDNDGQVHPLQILVHFKAPTQMSAKSLWQGPPEEYTAHIQIEVDTPNSLPLLEAVTLRAEVGTSRLHTPRDMDLIHLKTNKGGSSVMTLPLLNAGNIPLHLTLEITHWPDFFTITPSELTIPPKCNIEVEIKFHPAQTQSAMKFDSLLLMFVQPDGPGYEIALIGEVSASAPKVTPSTKEPVLLSNKHSLSWGAVPLGKTKVKIFELKSIAQEELLVKLLMPNNNKDFLFQNSSGVIERSSNSKEFVVQPGEVCPVEVKFCPTQIAHSSSKIQVKMVNHKVKYTVPLSGYGGTSKIIFEDCYGLADPQQTEIKAGPMTPGCNVIKKVTLKNIGHRIAYIKAVAFEDDECKRKLDEPNVVLQPNTLCIAPNKSQTFAILCQPTQEQVALCQKQSSVFMTLKFFCGDEASRQLLVRSSEKEIQRYVPSESTPALDVDFRSNFENEKIMKELESMDGFKTSPNDVVNFYTTMESLDIKFIGNPPPPPIIPSVDENAKSLTYNQLPSETFAPLSVLESSSLTRSRFEESLKSTPRPGCPIELTTPQSVSSKKMDSRSSERFLDVGDWEIQPKQIILNAPATGAEPEIQLVQLINFSERTMQYELSWPGHCIVLTPERGTLPPKCHSIISVSVNSTLKSRGITLPWSGVIHITCDNQTRMIKVQIHDGQKPLQSTEQPPIKPADNSVQLMQVSTHGFPTINSGPAGLKYKTQSLMFPGTTVRTTAELHLELKNISSDPVKWTIAEFAPPFMKENQSGDVHRLDYSAFWLPEKIGLMMPGEEKKVLVHFYPRLPGLYVQHWEVKCQTEASLVAMAYTSKLEFSGEGVDVSRYPEQFHSTANAEQPYHHQSSGNLSLGTVTRTSHLSSTLQSPAERLVAPKTWHLMFPQTSVGSKTECKLTIHNRDTTQSHRVTVIEPDEPFSIRHHNLKLRPRCYVNLPVKFAPHSAGLHKKPLIMTNDLGKTLSVTLEGHAV